MSFMQSQIVKTTVVEVETNLGDYFVLPGDLFSGELIKSWEKGFDPLDNAVIMQYAPEYISPSSDAIGVTVYHNKWIARLSAPGYMDCTDWNGPFDTKEEAEKYLEETYEEEEEEGNV